MKSDGLSEHKQMMVEEIKLEAESLKQQYDFFKHITTLTTGAFLVIVALWEVVFKNPSGKIFIALSLIFFSASLFCLVLVMKLFSVVLEKIWMWNFFSDTDNVKKDYKYFRGKTKIYNWVSSICFWLGIVSLLIFAMIEIF